ncbi:insulinase family protein [Pseudoalteromonas sp. BDTF-M6]|uniref:insulinase family protein n=1 Tax=Pseudoalteromonas sp. BDTF-M6 TaxID=2796132 RepID=UPI001BAED662|nr:insulinase family protein [Pseudoalteromonas sp. BDTF-M6]MBS3798865.1 insulinase family protein [Pseudoalteromonas sp. BDTF-M6]
MNISRNDNRLYQALTLPNGLRVLLVADSDSQKAAAALTVNAGHFDDPWHRQGLAHFVEHLLFLGTEKFPEAGEFHDFISRHGGSSNAWTGTEHSCYYFDITKQYFQPALERFSQLFIAPLFNDAEIDKERNAIDAEFKLKIKDDGRRIYQAHKETVNPKHPFAKFSVGSLDTLSDEQGPIKQELESFFSEHYQAQWMTLVLCGPYSLAQLQRWAEHLFTDLNSSTTSKPEIAEPLYRAQDLGLELHIEPHKHLQKLIISFAMPSIDKFYKHKTVSFLAHLLGYEGEGSLHSLLKSQGWINALSAGGGINGSNFKDFNISLALTDDGIEYYQDIVEMVFAYIALIRQNAGQLHALYRDKQTLLQIAFDNQEKARLLDWVSGLSVNMHHYPSEHYLYGDYLMAGYEPQQFAQVLDWLSPKNMRLVLIHPGVSGDKTTQWYNTPYYTKALEPQWLDALAAIDTPLSTMSLPEVNPYLQRPCVLHELESPGAIPEKLASHPGFNFWFKQDATYRVAKGHFYLAIDSQLAVKDVQHMALTRLFADLFIDCVAEQFYPAELAGLNYHLSSHQGGLTLHTAGLSSSQLELAQGLLDALFNADICAKRYAEYKKQLVRHWQSSNQNKPVSEIFSRIGAEIMPWNPTPEALAQALKSTSYLQFKQFREEFFAAVHIEAFLHGNWRPADAYDFLRLIQSHLEQRANIEAISRPLEEITAIVQQQLSLPSNDHAMVIYYQAASNNIEEKVLMMVVNHLLNQPYFNALRTEQQLGYLVGAGYAPFNSRAGLAFYVQSPNVEGKQLLAHHNHFISQYCQQVTQMDEQTWEHSKQSLYRQIAEKDKNLRLRSQRFWLAISNPGVEFTLQANLLSTLENIEFEQVLQYLHELFAPQRPRMEWLSDPLCEPSESQQSQSL